MLFHERMAKEQQFCSEQNVICAEKQLWLKSYGCLFYNKRGEKMNEFKKYHPLVNFIYFAFVIGFSCFFMHPVCLGISFVCGFLYSVMLKGRKAIIKNLMYMLPMFVAMAIINPAFNHEGITVLEYLPGGNPLTLESVIYGLCAAGMIICVICHFSCYNEVMTSDKFIYLFGKIIPSLSLVISMTLRFVPRFTAQLKVVSNAQRGMGKDVSKGSITARAKHGIRILSIMITWALENSIETADSMKARGYGIPGRTAFSIYTFDKRDLNALIYILITATYTICGYFMDGMYFRFFPSLKWAELTLFNISVFVSYFLFCISPIIIEAEEVRRWKALK